MKQRLNDYFLLISTRNKMRLIKSLSLLIQGVRKIIFLKNQEIQITRNNIHWEVDLSEAIDCNLYITGSYEPELADIMNKEISIGDTIIDIGANIGAHTLPMAQIVGKEGHVYAIEPTDYAFKKLAKNIKLNQKLSSSITSIKSFLSDGVSLPPKEISSSWSISSSMNSKNRNQLDLGIAKSLEDAQIQTLDELVLKQNITKVDIIKMDVDGYEVDVLKGASDTLERFSPVIFIEFSPIHYEAMDTEFREQVNLLTEYGYVFEDVFGRRMSSDANELMDYIPRGTLVNVIARKVNSSQMRKRKNEMKLAKLKEVLNEYMGKQRESWSFLKVMKPGYASKRLYAIYMMETYHYTFHNSRNQACIATRKEDLDINYIKFCLHHAEEEAGHEMMAFHDIKKLGYDLNKKNLPKPLDSTQELIRYIYDTAENGNPLARLGYSFWAERVYGYIKPLLSLMKVGAGIGNKSMTFFNEHSDIDAQHAEDVDRAIIRFAKTDEDWIAIEECMIGTLERTIKMTHEVLGEYDKVRAGDSTRYDSILGVK